MTNDDYPTPCSDCGARWETRTPDRWNRDPFIRRHADDCQAYPSNPSPILTKEQS